ncbi:MAG: chemotaxis protein CheA [Acidobacteria bacterium]|nr:chemotaxis protein CheA [Acidobacteriota bacterium]
MAGRKRTTRKKAAAEVPAVTLDDALAMLVQLDPENLDGFRQLAEMLQTVASGTSLDADAAELVKTATEQLDRFVSGENPDVEEVLVETSMLLEKASDSREAGLKNLRAECPAVPPAPSEPAESPLPKRADPEPEKTAVEWLPSDADPDLLAEFVAESRELLEKSESALLALESNPEDDEAVNTVFRAFHTVKGTSGFLGLKVTSELAHLAESLLSRIRNKEIRLVGGYADLALRSLDMLKKAVASVESVLHGAPMEVLQGYDDLKVILTNPEAAGVSEEESSGMLHSSPAVETQEPKISPEKQTAQRRTEFESSIRVNTARLDRLIDMVGELVIAQSMVVQDSRLLDEGCHELARKVTHANKIVRELQDLSMSMRMVPLRGTFQKMQRVARDLARKSGKSVELVTDDGETEIDRHMVDILNDVLVHMVRNAIDHGIEPPEDRAKSCKPEAGSVRLTAFHSGGTVVVEIRDDGRGLNREKIFAKAVAAGIVDPDKSYSDNEVFNLIFAPGLSTSDKVTDVSGRGVGMDVVRRGIEALHGRIDITSSPGIGSVFTVRLPLTLAITDGMLVRVGSERYIIPTIGIHLCFRPEPESLSTVSGKGELVMLRGEMMPIFRLHRLFGIESAIEDPAKGLLVVVGDEERRCALLVDELLGQQQVVAKSLTKAVGKIQGVSGGAILGDGQVGLILDPGEVAAQARHSTNPYGTSGQYGRPAA